VKRPKSLPAFSGAQKSRAHLLLATRVAYMMGRKLEEADWSSAYCRAKGIPERGWSNLSIDVMYQGLGVEHKMLCVRSDRPIRSYCGERLMHPSATRAIRLPDSRDANEVMSEVLSQYAALLKARKDKLKEDAPDKKPDLRTGWMLWQESLAEFLYFEEEAAPPNPNDYKAEWKESGGGTRKTSRNVWVYEKDTGDKRYSITTSAGPKIQPYFDVPPPTDPNLCIFRAQGEEIGEGIVRIWVTLSTGRELEGIVGSLTPERLSLFIANVAANLKSEAPGEARPTEEATPLTLLLESYTLLTSIFPNAVSDEHRMRLLVAALRT
jgi:hypothetical protein